MIDEYRMIRIENVVVFSFIHLNKLKNIPCISRVLNEQVAINREMFLTNIS